MKFVYYFLLLFPLLSFSQNLNDKIIFLDSLGTETNEGNHKFYKIIEDYQLTKSLYKVSKYFASGKLKESGFSKQKNYFIAEGEVYNYFENGSVKSIVNFIDNIPNGNCIFWHENGTKKLEGNYIIKQEKNKIEVLLKVDNYWDENNNQKVIYGEGEMIDSGEFETFASKCISKGKMKNGLKEGEWIGENEKPNFTFTEFYEKGKLISGVSIDSENNSYNYTVAQIPPVSKGGMERFYKYIMTNFQLPENFTQGGTLVTNFVIEKEGSIVDLSTEKGLRKDIDAEAIRLISKYKDFSPGLLRGIKIRCSYSIPITLQGLK